MLNNNTDRVLQYLDGEMDAPSRAAFERQLEEDKELKRELAVQREMLAALRARRKAALKSELGEMWAKIKKEHAPDETTNEKNRTVDMVKLRRVAVRVAAGLAAAGLLLNQLGGALGKPHRLRSQEEKERKKGKKKK